MTTTDPTTLACPQCGRADSVDMSGGERLCLNCRNEWNPATVKAAPARVPAAPVLDTEDRIDTSEILRAESVADILGPVLTPTERWQEHMGIGPGEPETDLAGLFVRVSGEVGRRLYVVTIDAGDPAVTITDETGTARVIDRDLLQLADEENEAEAAQRAEDVADDEPFVSVIASVAALVLTVGLESVADDEGRTLLNPRIGWLPPPASDIPEVEQGAAYAVAILVKVFGLDRSQVAEVASNLMAGAAESVAETETE